MFERCKYNFPTGGIPFFPWILGILHLGMAFVFTHYITSFGGDAIRFWEFPVRSEGILETWMGYWGTRTLFIQWLNYPFSQLLGIPFWLGNVLYALLTCWAFLRLYWFAVGVLWLYGGNTYAILLLQGVFLLPNIHFWTAGIGKEGLAFVALVLIVEAWTHKPNAWIYLLLGIFLSWMIRPFQGMVFLTLASIWLYQSPTSKRIKWVLGILLALVSIPAYFFIRLISHIPSLSLEGLQAFFQGQQEFLEGFNAASYVSMESYGWWEVLGTFLFRPFIWEASSFWQVAAGLENCFSLLALPFFLLTCWHPRFPKQLWPIWLAGVLILGVYAFSVNNWGIMMRLKSIFMLFYFIGAVWGVQLLINIRQKSLIS